MAFKMVILNMNVFPVSQPLHRPNLVEAQIRDDSRDTLRRIQQNKAKVVIAASAAGSEILCWIPTPETERLCYSISVNEENAEQMVRTIIKDHGVCPSETLYVDRTVAGVHAVSRTGATTCLMDPLGAPRINFSERPVADWNIYALCELPSIIAAQQ